MRLITWLLIKITLIWGIWQLMWNYTLIWKGFNHNFSWLEIFFLVLIFHAIRSKFPEKKI